MKALIWWIDKSLCELMPELPLENRFCVHDLHQKKVNENNANICVLGINTLPENYIACVLQSDLGALSRIDQNVQTFGAKCEFMVPYLPMETEICIAKHASIWYRCMFVKLLGSTKTALVYSLDFGDFLKVD